MKNNLFFLPLLSLLLLNLNLSACLGNLDSIIDDYFQEENREEHVEIIIKAPSQQESLKKTTKCYTALHAITTPFRGIRKFFQSSTKKENLSEDIQIITDDTYIKDSIRSSQLTQRKKNSDISDKMQPKNSVYDSKNSTILNEQNLQQIILGVSGSVILLLWAYETWLDLVLAQAEYRYR